MTTITWYTLRGTDDPINGNPAEFDQVEQRFRTIKQDVAGLGDEFRGIRAGNDDFSGDAAASFSSKIASICTALDDVPVICQSIADLFDQHAAALRALQAEADAALARAQTQWNLLHSADTDRANAQSRLQFVDDQLEFLEAQGPTADATDKAYWTAERREAIDWRNGAKQRRDNAQGLLDDELERWGTLRGQEEQLDEDTANKLRNLELWSMSDPSLIEQIGAAFADLVEAFSNFAEYVFSMDMLLDLYHLIDDIITVLGVLAIVMELLAYVA